VLLPLVLLNVTFTGLMRLLGNDQISSRQFLLVVVCIVAFFGLFWLLNQLSDGEPEADAVS